MERDRRRSLGDQDRRGPLPAPVVPLRPRPGSAPPIRSQSVLLPEHAGDAAVAHSPVGEEDAFVSAPGSPMSPVYLSPRRTSLALLFEDEDAELVRLASHESVRERHSVVVVEDDEVFAPTTPSAQAGLPSAGSGQALAADSDPLAAAISNPLEQLASLGQFGDLFAAAPQWPVTPAIPGNESVVTVDGMASARPDSVDEGFRRPTPAQLVQPQQLLLFDKDQAVAEGDLPLLSSLQNLDPSLPRPKRRSSSLALSPDASMLLSTVAEPSSQVLSPVSASAALKATSLVTAEALVEEDDLDPVIAVRVLSQLFRRVREVLERRNRDFVDYVQYARANLHDCADPQAAVALLAQGKALLLREITQMQQAWDALPVTFDCVTGQSEECEAAAAEPSFDDDGVREQFTRFQREASAIEIEVEFPNLPAHVVEAWRRSLTPELERERVLTKLDRTLQGSSAFCRVTWTVRNSHGQFDPAPGTNRIAMPHLRDAPTPSSCQIAGPTPKLCVFNWEPIQDMLQDPPKAGHGGLTLCQLVQFAEEAQSDNPPITSVSVPSAQHPDRREYSHYNYRIIVKLDSAGSVATNMVITCYSTNAAATPVGCTPAPLPPRTDCHLFAPFVVEPFNLAGEFDALCAAAKAAASSPKAEEKPKKVRKPKKNGDKKKA